MAESSTCDGELLLNARDGNTIGWVCTKCDWNLFADKPALERLIEMSEQHGLRDVKLMERWYCIDGNGDPGVHWEAHQALQSASNWPSVVRSVIHLHGTALHPKIDVIWTPPMKEEN